MATVQSPSDQRMVLYQVSWDTYEHLLKNYENSSAPRFTYDRGTLEIMSPLPKHERLAWAAERLIEAVLALLGLEYDNLRTTTFKRQDLETGFEPDACFYTQHEAEIRGKERIDLHVDPPPDLVVEIDITHPSIDKMPIYARLGVPEVWRHDGEKLQILLLQGSEYVEAGASRALPVVRAGEATRLLAESNGLGRAAWLERLRQCVSSKSG